MTTRAQVVAIARSWLDPETPWQHQGMEKGVGADCLGFIAGVALEAGFFDARPMLRDEAFRGYGRDPNPQMLDQATSEYADRISIRDATTADVLQFLVPRALYPQHFGLVTEIGDDGKPSYVIHCTSGYPRRVVEHRIDRNWWTRIRRVHRFRGIE